MPTEICKSCSRTLHILVRMEECPTLELAVVVDGERRQEWPPAEGREVAAGALDAILDSICCIGF